MIDDILLALIEKKFPAQQQFINIFHRYEVLKETEAWEFRPFFSEKIQPGPHMNTGTNGFAKIFVFAKIFDHKVKKSYVRVVIDYADTQFLL